MSAGELVLLLTSCVLALTREIPYPNPIPNPLTLTLDPQGHLGSGEYENWSLPSRDTARETVVPVSCLGSRVEPAFVAGLLVSHLKVCDKRKASCLISSGNSQAQIRGFELTHSNIYSTDDQLKCMKGQIQNYMDLHNTGPKQVKRSPE